MEAQLFDRDTIYLADDPALAKIASYQTLANWRHAGKGPAYVKLGGRVGYLGCALNEWIERQTVRPGEPVTA